MAKKEKKVLEKKNWSNSFVLIGEAKINDYTYKLDEKSDVYRPCARARLADVVGSKQERFRPIQRTACGRPAGIFHIV